MKAIKYAKSWDVACVEQEKPVCGKGQALIKIMTAGICRSDISSFRGTNGLVSYPRIIGHELAGVIEEIDLRKTRQLLKSRRKSRPQVRRKFL